MAQNIAHVPAYRAEMAERLLPMTRANADAAVIAACIRIRQGWLLGAKVERADFALIEAFA